MRSIAAGALVTLLAGCPARETLDCGNGFLCPVGTACAEPGHCGDPTLVSLCFEAGKQEFESCQATTFSGTCRDGVCTACTPDLAGCGQAKWQVMTSPVAPDRLEAVWVVPPATGMPATHAFAGGVNGDFIEYDGRSWARAAKAPPTTDAIVSIWGSAADDLYVVTNSGDAFHFDGSAWRNIRADLATSAAITSIHGTARTDVYAVGLQNTVLHFDGATWGQVTSPAAGPQYAAVVATSGGPVAVGGLGYVYQSPGPAALLMPAAVKGEDLKAVSLHGGNPVAVGSTTSTTLNLCERINGTWMTVGSGTAFNLFAVWNDFAGGYGGQILHANGGTWSVMETPTGGGTVYGISGGGGDVFAVGDSGQIWRYFEP